MSLVKPNPNASPVSEEEHKAECEKGERDHEKRRDVYRQVVGVEIKEGQNLISRHIHSQPGVRVAIEVVPLRSVKPEDTNEAKKEIITPVREKVQRNQKRKESGGEAEGSYSLIRSASKAKFM